MSRIWYFLFCIIVAFSYLPILVSAQPITGLPTTNNVFPRSGQECSFDGNPDIYGPGIRIGIYAQTLAVSLARYFIISQVFGLRDTLTVFSIALLTVAILLAASASSMSVNAVEFFIILQILSWNCVTGLRARSTYAREALRNREARVFAMDAMNMSALGLHVWFWFRGIEAMGRGGNGECKFKVFFFVETELEGWFRNLMKVMTILTLADHGQELFRRLTAAWGGGLRWEMDKEIKEAVEGFEEWKRSRVLSGTIDVSTGLEGSEIETNNSSQPGSSCEIATEENGSIDGSSLPRSNTRNSDSTRMDEESISGRVTHIRMQHLSDSSAESLPGPISDVETAQHSTTVPPAFKCQLFEDIYAGELFLQHCRRASSTAQFQKRHPRLYIIFLHLWVVGRPQKHSNSSSDERHSNAPSYAKCLKTMLRALFTLTFPRRAAVLYTHLVSLHTLDPINAPYQLHTAIKYPSSTDSPLPPPHTLALASRILVAQLPPPTLYHKYSQAFIHLFMHTFMILQIELTIKWNGIKGLGGVSNVGQLIPLLVGVGGLALVVARGIEGACKGIKVWKNGGRRDEGSEEWKALVATYEEWKGILKTEKEIQNTTNVTI